jgi:hypothetical protein
VRLVAALVALSLGSVALAALPVGATPAPRDPVPGPALHRSVLTTDGAAYRYRHPGRRLVVTAARHVIGQPNRREIVAAGPRQRDQTVCATWVRQPTWRGQPGLAVRVVDRGGRVRAVTLTKNIVFGVQSVLNVVTWDTARDGDPWRGVAQFDLADELLDQGRLRPLPWRACLRVHGRTVRFKVWLPRERSEPSWSDPTAARSAVLPKAFVLRGRAGWYVGHLPSGGRMVYRGLTSE